MKKNQVVQLQICLRMGNHFDDFRKAKQFNDCVLVSDTEERFPCQRLILAQVSGWFDRYFNEHPIKKIGDICEVQVPVNPDHILEKFIELIYTNYSEITISNLPLLLKMAVYYECPTLVRALKHFYLDATNDDTVLHLAKKFIELDLIEDAKSLAPSIAKHLKRIHNNETDLRFSIDELFQSLSPPVFASVINEDLLKKVGPNERKFTDEDKVRYIDNFVLFNGREITDEEEKEALASPVDWKSPLAFQYLTRHQCDWLPARISRPLINRILNNRRLILNGLRRSMKKATDKVSRWYVYSWAQSCRNAITVRGEPRIDVINFIRTLGGITKPLDPVRYGFFHTFCTPGKPLTEDFSPSNVVLDNDQLYFMAQKEGDKYPGVGIDLGQGSRFQPYQISLNTHVLQRPYTSTRPSNPKPYAKKFCFKIGLNQEECINSYTHCKNEIPPENEGKIKDLSVTVDEKCNVFMFQLDGPQTNGGYMMRVVSIEVNGSFECS